MTVWNGLSFRIATWILLLLHCSCFAYLSFFRTHEPFNKHIEHSFSLHSQRKTTLAKAPPLQSALEVQQEMDDKLDSKLPTESTVVVGAGPSGLATAIMLARRGWKNIKVYDRLGEPESPESEFWGNSDRSYNIGIGARGQKALAAFGALERIKQYCAPVNARRDWSPQSEDPVFTDLTKTRSYTTQVIQRDRLTSVLYEEIREKYSDQVEVIFDTICEDVIWPENSGEQVTLSLKQKKSKKVDAPKQKTIASDPEATAISETIVESGPEVDVPKQKTIASYPEATTTSETIVESRPEPSEWSKQSFISVSSGKTLAEEEGADSLDNKLSNFFGGVSVRKEIKDRAKPVAETTLTLEVPEKLAAPKRLYETMLKDDDSLMMKMAEVSKAPEETVQVPEETVVGIETVSATSEDAVADGEQVIGSENLNAATKNTVLDVEKTSKDLETKSEPEILERTFTEKTSLLIGADGVRSSVRRCMEADVEFSKKTGFKAVEFPPRNTRVYKTIPIRFPDSWRKDINYSVRTKSGVNFDALPTLGGDYIGSVLFKPETTLLTDLKTGKEAKEFFKENFPQFVDFISDEDYEKLAQKPVSKLPEFTYTKSVLHKEDNAVLVGDTIHTVKPYFGLGLNSALEDIAALNDCLDQSKDNTRLALSEYSKKRAKNAKVLVEISRSLDGGFLTFVLPLILDGITNKFAPKIFGPNTIRMLQREDLSFVQVRRKKRIDRLLQISLLGTFMILAAQTGLFVAKIARRLILSRFFG